MPRWPLPIGRDHVDDPLRHGRRAGFEPEPLVGEQRRELVEVPPLLRRLVGVHVVDLLDLEQRPVLLVVAGLAHLAGDDVALAELVLAHLRHRDVDVVLTREVARRAHEAVAVGEQVEDPGCGGSGLQRFDALLLLTLPALLAHAAGALPSWDGGAGSGGRSRSPDSPRSSRSPPWGREPLRPPCRSSRWRSVAAGTPVVSRRPVVGGRRAGAITLPVGRERARTDRSVGGPSGARLDRRDGALAGTRRRRRFARCPVVRRSTRPRRSRR